jgi:hypothetical protein
MRSAMLCAQTFRTKVYSGSPRGLCPQGSHGAVRAGFLFFVAITDLFSRKVVGWALGDRLDAELSCEPITRVRRLPSRWRRCRMVARLVVGRGFLSLAVGLRLGLSPLGEGTCSRWTGTCASRGGRVARRPSSSPGCSAHAS